jgi:hypothetical protein
MVEIYPDDGTVVAGVTEGVAEGVARDANMLVYFELPVLDVTAVEAVPGVNFDPELTVDFGFEMR